MSDIPSCLKTCSREFGHARDCPVGQAQKYLPEQHSDAYVAPRRSEGVQGAYAEPTISPAALEWGKAAAELHAAKKAVDSAEVALDKAKARLASAYGKAHAARGVLDAEVRGLLDEDGPTEDPEEAR